MGKKGGEISISQFSNVPCPEDYIFKDYCAKNKIIFYCPIQYTCNRSKIEGQLTTALAVPEVPTSFPFGARNSLSFAHYLYTLDTLKIPRVSAIGLLIIFIRAQACYIVYNNE